MDKWDTTDVLGNDELELITASQGGGGIVAGTFRGEEPSLRRDVAATGNGGERYDLDGELTTSFHGTLAECVEHTLLKSLSHCADFSRSTPLALRLNGEAEAALNNQLSVLESKLKHELSSLQQHYSNFVTKETIRRRSPVAMDREKEEEVARAGGAGAGAGAGADAGASGEGGAAAASPLGFVAPSSDIEAGAAAMDEQRVDHMVRHLENVHSQYADVSKRLSISLSESKDLREERDQLSNEKSHLELNLIEAQKSFVTREKAVLEDLEREKVRSSKLVKEVERVRRASQEHVAAIQKSTNSGEFQSLKELCSKMYNEVCSSREREDKLKRKLAQYKVGRQSVALKKPGETVREITKGAYDSRRRIRPELRKLRMKRYPSDPCLYHDDKPFFAQAKGAAADEKKKPEEDQTNWEAAMRDHLGDSFKERANGRGLDLSIKSSPFVLMKEENGRGTGR